MFFTYPSSPGSGSRFFVAVEHSYKNPQVLGLHFSELTKTGLSVGLRYFCPRRRHKICGRSCLWRRHLLWVACGCGGGLGRLAGAIARSLSINLVILGVCKRLLALDTPSQKMNVFPCSMGSPPLDWGLPGHHHVFWGISKSWGLLKSLRRIRTLRILNTSWFTWFPQRWKPLLNPLQTNAGKKVF